MYTYIYTFTYACVNMFWGPTGSGICMPCTHMNAYAFTCMPACPHLHMRALHMHGGICIHGMHAPAHACKACMHICMAHPMRTSTPHPSKDGSRWCISASPWADPFRSRSYDRQIHNAPHIPQGGMTITTPSPRVGRGGRSPIYAYSTCTYLYIYICLSTYVFVYTHKYVGYI